MGAGMAERVVAGNQPHDIVLEVRIKRTRTVPGTERVFFGALAGRNAMVSTNRLLDRKGTVLRSFTVESASAAHPFSGESGASDAYRQFATDAGVRAAAEASVASRRPRNRPGNGRAARSAVLPPPGPSASRSGERPARPFPNLPD